MKMLDMDMDNGKRLTDRPTDRPTGQIHIIK